MRSLRPDFDLLFLPGRGNSGAAHWQTRWLGTFPNSSRLLQGNWDAPDPVDWVSRLNAAITSTARPVVLVAHSLSTIATTRWAAGASPQTLAKVAAAFLVAVTDVENPDPSFDPVRSFAPVPMQPLPFPTAVIASRNDPRVSLARAEAFAAVWGAEFHDAGTLGHMGNDDRLGLWPEGILLLGRLLERAGL